MNIESFSAQTTRKNYWRDPDYVLWFIKSICFFNLAVVINYFATRLATKNAGGYVDDLFFNILPRIDTSFIDKYGALLLYFFTFALIVIYQKRGPFLINCLALLIIIRAFFINLTYLGVPEGTTQTQNFFTQGGDLFFSGHTALPFMIALVFWDNKSLRYLYLVITFIMASQVLLGRFHYSIDVFAAPFIVYGVYSFAARFFRKN